MRTIAFALAVMGCAEASGTATTTPGTNHPDGAAGSASIDVEKDTGTAGTPGLPTNPCTDGTADCSENATCSGSSNGSYDCACKPGFTGDGKVCEKSKCELLEGFEKGWPQLPWTAAGGGPTGTGPQAAHDGLLGLVATEWSIHQFVSVGHPGDRLTAWVRGFNGRAYLGFGSTPKGTKAFVFAPNANALLFDDCPKFYEFVDVASTPLPTGGSSWQKIEVEFGTGGQVTGRLYGVDGTLVTSLTHVFDDLVPSGIAVRNFNDTFLDTIELCRE